MRLIELSSKSPRLSALQVVLATALTLPLVCHAQQSGMSDLARAELQRRATAATEAEELIKSGDVAYEEGKYKEASIAYRGALDLLPKNAPVVAPQRRALIQRLVQSSVEEARALSRLGDVAAANGVMDLVLNENVAPDAPEALAMREQLSDPIRTNPAITREHAQDIDEVRQLLYLAQGAHDLGTYAKAAEYYEAVLRIDPTNSAARRGMERAALSRSSYAKAAYDQTRAEMLSQVDAQWELTVPPLEDLGADFAPDLETDNYIDKLSLIIVPEVALDDVTIAEAVDFVRQRSIELDTFESDPARKGINIVLDLGSGDSEASRALREAQFSINLRNVPLRELINYICTSSRTVLVEQPFAMVIRPSGSDSPDMIVKTYRVPPDFLTSNAGPEEADENLDPFATDSTNQGSLPRRLTAEEVLKDRGVSFPEGASATFNASNSTLRVRNTIGNQSIVDQIIKAIANEEPTAIVVDVKMIKTTQQRLEELSFDWLLGDFGLSDSTVLTGGTRGNGGGINDVGIPLEYATQRNPITSGNRSGTEGISFNSIDDLLAGGGRVSSGGPVRAPGALWVNGKFNDTHVTMLMRGLDQKTGIDLAAVPSVTTRSGQAASIRITREFIYPTEYEPPELPNQVGGGGGFVDLTTGDVFAEEVGLVPVTPSTPTSFDMREVGVVLEVLPTASKDKRYVDISIKPDFTDFDGFINYGTPILAGQTTTINPSPFSLGDLFGTRDQVITPNEILMPVFSKIGTETSLTLADNATVVIGGLLEERSEKIEDKTPVLGDIPVVGRLFQSHASRPVKTAIILLVKVRVVDAAGRPFNQ